MKREKDPHYLQDTILPKEAERKGGFDLDREFGKEFSKRIEHVLRDSIHSELANARATAVSPDPTNQQMAKARYFDTLRACARYRTLFEKTCWNDDDEKEMQQVFKDRGAHRRTKFKYSSNATNNLRLEIAASGIAVFGDQISRAERVAFAAIKDFYLQEIQKGGRLGARIAAFYRIVFGKKEWSTELDQQIQEALNRSLADQESGFVTAGFEAATLRILRAHDLKFTPGKGIEIIDDPPAEFEKKTEPIPEERKF